MNSLGLDLVSFGNTGSAPISDFELERIAREEIDQLERGVNGKSLQVHLVSDGEHNIIERVVFYTLALHNYFERVRGDYAKARNTVRDVLQQMVDDKGHTTMYRILSDFARNSPFTQSVGSVSIRVRDFVNGYLLNCTDVMLYAASQPSFIPDDSTPSVTVKLKS